MASKRNKTAIALLSSTLLVGLLAGCGGSNNAANGGTGSDATNGGGDDTSPITYTFFSSDPNPNWMGMQDDVGKKITEITGVTLNAEFAVGDPVQKVGMIAASGEYPDLISAKQDVNKLVDAGAMLDLTDLIEEHAPNIKKVLGEEGLKRSRYSLDDQAIYVIPSYDGVGNTYFDAGGGFGIQHRAVKEAGYPDIVTVKDFENVIKSYLEKNPVDENGNKNIGLTLNADDWYMYITVTNPSSFTTGHAEDGEYGIDIDTQEVIYHYRRAEDKEYFRWLNHMNDIGLLDPESFVQKYDQYKAKIASGRVIGLIDQDWGYGEAENALKSQGKYDQGYGHYPVVMEEGIKESSFWPTGFMAGSGVGISKTAKDPVRLIKFLDFLASDEGQVLINWGIEGTHYDVVDGKRVIPEDVKQRKYNDTTNYQKETGMGSVGGSYALLSARYGDGVLDPTGNYYTTRFPDEIISSYSDAEKETLEAYGATTWKDLFPSEDEFPVRPWGAAWSITVPTDSEILVLDNKLRDITWKRIPEAILAPPAEFDTIWDNYMAELDAAGVEKAEDLREELVKQRVQLWND